MSLRALLVLALAVASTAVPATALAAPDHHVSLAGIDSSDTWTSDEKTGAVYGSDVTDNAPVQHCSELWSCDATLISTQEYGDLVVDITGKGVKDQDTLSDIDLHLYVSNADGDQGELIGESTSSSAFESYTATDVPAGYYLAVVDWYLGAGSYDGTAYLLEPTTPTDTPPAFEPAPAPLGEAVTYSRTFEFSAAAHDPQAWTSLPTAGVSDVQPQIGCNQVNCDWTLIKVDDPGILDVTSASATLVDADVYLFRSDEEGRIGTELGSGTSFGPDESVGVEVDPGYYLMRVQSTGAGTYDGTAGWSEPPPPDEE